MPKITYREATITDICFGFAVYPGQVFGFTIAFENQDWCMSKFRPMWTKEEGDDVNEVGLGHACLELMNYMKELDVTDARDLIGESVKIKFKDEKYVTFRFIPKPETMVSATPLVTEVSVPNLSRELSEGQTITLTDAVFQIRDSIRDNHIFGNGLSSGDWDSS